MSLTSALAMALGPSRTADLALIRSVGQTLSNVHFDTIHIPIELKFVWKVFSSPIRTVILAGLS